MPKAVVHNLAGEQTAEVELAARVFAAEPRPWLLHQAVVARLARQRAGTHATRKRGQVRATTRKPYRQKGTGLARAGSLVAPGRRGGGIVFGPQPRRYGGHLATQARRQALREALTAKLRAQELLVVEELALGQVSTRELAGALEVLGVSGRRVLLVPGAPAVALGRSAANLGGVEVQAAGQLNAYEVLACQRLVLDREALRVLQERCR